MGITDTSGHAMVPRTHAEDGFNLGGWLLEQRRLRKAGKLSPLKIAVLERLGASLTRPRDARWARPRPLQNY